jgi:hypothetical protein
MALFEDTPQRDVLGSSRRLYLPHFTTSAYSVVAWVVVRARNFSQALVTGTSSILLTSNSTSPRIDVDDIANVDEMAPKEQQKKGT